MRMMSLLQSNTASRNQIVTFRLCSMASECLMVTGQRARKYPFHRAASKITRVGCENLDSDAVFLCLRRCHFINGPSPQPAQPALVDQISAEPSAKQRTNPSLVGPARKSRILTGIYNPTSVVRLFELIVPMPVSKIPLTPNPLLNMVLFRIIVPTGSPCGDP